MTRYITRVFMIYDTHEVELPDHDTAVSNINWNDPRILVRRYPV